MKKFIIGIFIGVLLASGVWYYLIDARDNSTQNELRSLVTSLQQQQKAKELAENVLDKQGLQISGEKIFTIITSQSGYYYFEGPDCSSIKLGSLTDVNKGIDKAKTKYGDNLMVIIKETNNAPHSMAANLVNEVDKVGLKPGQFTSLILSNIEKNCIQSYKK